jgi:hypothetical protein
MIYLACTILIVVLLPSCLTPGSLAQTQTLAPKKSQTKSEAKTDESKAKLSEADLLEAQRRAFAISLLMSLADEARSYRDLALRPRVLARAADMLWDADSDAARTQFRRAWEAAEKADAEDVTTPQTKDGSPVMVIAIRKVSDGDLRSEVLSLAARRDRQLGEEFLAKLTEQTNREATEATSNATQSTNDSWSTSQAASKRLLLARRLLDEDQIERALEFAAPVLNQVNEKTISFLEALRAKRPELADQRFVLLLASAELDPTSDANTVSGLSSYAFTPGLYVTFSANGSVSWLPAEEPIASPNLPPTVRNRFFRVAANILLRPLPPPDQDFTSAGRTGKYLVIKRLLPLFDQYETNTAVALRSQLAALTGERLPGVLDNDDDFLMTQGIKSEASLGDALENMQEQLDHARTSRERDAIYEDAAAVLANQGDARAQDLADKIDNVEWRAIVRQYVDLSLVQFAVGKKNAASVARLAKAGALSHTQRAWAYTQAARLLMNSQRSSALDLMEEALAEARRIETDDPNRARMLIGVATQLLDADHVRAWEIVGEAVKAANAVPEFSGEDEGLNFALATASGLKFIRINESELSLASVVRSLAKEDLTRANDLAKSLRNDAPRAVATLAIARAAFEKSEKKAGTLSPFLPR